MALKLGLIWQDTLVFQEQGLAKFYRDCPENRFYKLKLSRIPVEISELPPRIGLELNSSC